MLDCPLLIIADAIASAIDKTVIPKYRCSGKACAWWNKETNSCAVLTIAKNLSSAANTD